MRTVILCMPRCGSKFLQHVLTEQQGAVSTILPSPQLQRENFWCSLEEFTLLKPGDRNSARCIGNDVIFDGTYTDVYKEFLNRLSIMRELDNYVVKHFVYPDPHEFTPAVCATADNLIVLRRKDLFDQALSFAVATRYGNYMADEGFASTREPFEIDVDRFVSLYKNFQQGDKFLASKLAPQYFMEDIIHINKSEHFGREYGPEKHKYLKNYEKIKKAVDCS